MTSYDLIGRETEMSTIQELLRVRSLLLVGPRRVGKTALCREVVSCRDRGWHAVRVDLEKVASLEGAAALIEEVPWWLDALRASSGDASARQALAALRHLRERDDLIGRFRMILTGSIGLAGLARSVGATAEINDLMPPLDVRPLSSAAGRALFEVVLAERRLRPTPDAAGLAMSEAGGFPHWIKLIAERCSPSEAGVVDGPQVAAACGSLLVPAMRNLFEDEGHEHLRRRHPGVARALVAVLDAASGDRGATFSALLTAALAAQPTLSRRAAEECIYVLGDEYYLTEVEGTWRFLLPLFRSWWTRFGGEA